MVALARARRQLAQVGASVTYRAKCDGRRLQREVRAIRKALAIRCKLRKLKRYSWASVRFFVDGVEMKEVKSISYSEPKPPPATPVRVFPSGIDYTTTFRIMLRGFPK